MKIKLSNIFPDNILESIILTEKFGDEECTQKQIKEELNDPETSRKIIRWKHEHNLHVSGKNDYTLERIADYFDLKLEISSLNKKGKKIVKSYGNTSDEKNIKLENNQNGWYKVSSFITNNDYTPRGLKYRGNFLSSLLGILNFLKIPVKNNILSPCPLKEGRFQFIENEFNVNVNVYSKIRTGSLVNIEKILISKTLYSHTMNLHR